LEFAGSLVNEVTYMQPLKKVIVMAIFVTKTGYLWQLSLYSRRDCETCWSLTFNMTGHVITLYLVIRSSLLHMALKLTFFLQAITSFVQILRHAELAHHIFAGLELAVLKDIHQLLEVPYAVQQLLSSSWTPSLSVALPAFKVLIECWKQT
jgi:hypothetical protein